MTNESRSKLVDVLSEEKTALAYFYLGAGHVQSAADVLLGLIEQLCSRLKWVPSSLRETSVKPSGDKGLLKLLLNALVELSNREGDVIVLIDAWEPRNMSSSEDFATMLRKLRETPWKVLIFSRVQLPEVSADIEISIQHNAIRRDLEDFARHIITAKKNAPAFRLFEEDTNLAREVAQKLVNDADGSFFWVTLQRDLIMSQTSRFAINETLRRIPKERSKIAREAIKMAFDQPEPCQYLAQHSLLWLSDLPEPLTIEGLQEALALVTALRNPETAAAQSDCTPTKAALLKCWKGLVTIDASSNSVTLAQDGLERTIAGNCTMPGIASMAEVCLSYLLRSEMSRVRYSRPEDIRDACHKHKFLTYASRCWAVHSRSSSSPVVNRLVLALLQGDKRKNLVLALSVNEWYRQQFIHPDSWHKIIKQIESRPSLSVAVHFRLVRVLDDLLLSAGRPEEIDWTDQSGRTALHEAAIADEVDIARILLNSEASLFVRDDAGKTPIHYACELKHCRMFDILYHESCKRRLHDQAHEAKAPFQDLLQPEIEMIQAYFDKQPYVIDYRSHTDALCGAIQKADSDHFESLVFRVKNVNWLDRNGVPPLHYAIRQRSESYVCLLLNRGADPSVTANDKQALSAVHEAVKAGDVVLTKMLLAHGGNTNTIDGSGRTSLFSTLDYYLDTRDEDITLELAQQLLKNRIDILAVANTGRQILHEAADKGAFPLVRLLVQFVPDVDATDGNHKTAAQYAHDSRHFEIERFLLERLNVATRLKRLKDATNSAPSLLVSDHNRPEPNAEAWNPPNAEPSPILALSHSW
jgi:uncharacterized protein